MCTVISDVLRERKISQSRLCRETGMHTSSMSQIVSGRLKPYPGQVEKIVKALDWKGDPAELFEEAKR